jgi:hypothetical protein
MHATTRQRGGLNRSPSEYLEDEVQAPDALKTHYVDEVMYKKIRGGEYDQNVDEFFHDRAELMYKAVQSVASESIGIAAINKLKAK